MTILYNLRYSAFHEPLRDVLQMAGIEVVRAVFDVLLHVFRIPNHRIVRTDNVNLFLDVGEAAHTGCGGAEGSCRAALPEYITG